MAPLDMLVLTSRSTPALRPTLATQPRKPWTHTGTSPPGTEAPGMRRHPQLQLCYQLSTTARCTTAIFICRTDSDRNTPPPTSPQETRRAMTTLKHSSTTTCKRPILNANPRTDLQDARNAPHHPAQHTHAHAQGSSTATAAAALGTTHVLRGGVMLGASGTFSWTSWDDWGSP